jgi:hypothetical protein
MYVYVVMISSPLEVPFEKEEEQKQKKIAFSER